jgi:endonuclease/exonuclease/phosphatase family metal-dependent hydrolase
MKFKKRYFLVILLSLFCGAVYTYHYFFLTNNSLYNALSYAIPGIWTLNVLLLLYAVWARSKWLWCIPFVLLIYSYNISRSLVGLNFAAADTKADLKVLSYNVGTFNLDRFHRSDTIVLSDSIVIAQQRQFLRSCKADVICLQEFYNNDAVDFTSSLDEMAEMGYKYFYTNPILIDEYEGFFGVITFSRFPIIDKGKITFEYKENKRAMNTAIYTDLLVNEDTVRVVNVHLHSMDLRATRVVKSLRSDTLADEINLFKAKLEYGFMKRGLQIEVLENEILKKGGNIILVGDLNDMPFAFSYRTLKKYLNNSFEHAGRGLGFTYNKFPWFIRIDNQFYSPTMKINYFTVDKKNKRSDHYPIVAGYSFRSKHRKA